MFKRLLLPAILLGFGPISYGQNCLDIYQLERMLVSSISYEEIDGFLRQNSYYSTSSSSSTLILEKDSLSTIYFKNAGYNGSFATIHNTVGTTSRIVVFYNANCSYSFLQKILEESYVLIKDEEIKTYRKGNYSLLIYPNGTIVLYDKSTDDFRRAIQKRRESRQELLVKLESQFSTTIETYRSKLFNLRLKSKATDFSLLYNQFNEDVSDGFKTRSEYTSLKNDILDSWKVKLTNEVNVEIRNLEFARALDIVYTNAFPDQESVEKLIDLIAERQVRHELTVLELSLRDAVLSKNFEHQIDLAAQIIKHPMVSAIQKSEAEKTSIKAKETLQIIAKRKSTTISYWQHYPDIKAQVEKTLHEYLLSKVKHKKRGEFVFAMSVQFDTSGVQTTRYYIESEDEDLKFKMNVMLTPVVIANLYFKSSDTLYFNSSWSTNRHVSVSSYKGIEHSNLSSWNSDLSALISRSPSKFGTYKFDIQSLIINGRPYSGIQFVNHRVGRSVISNFVKSLIVPGLGRRAANYGQPNTKFQEILLLGASAVGAEFYSQDLLATYNQDPTNSELFDEAQFWHRLSLGCAAIGAIDYVNEQFYVLYKSFRNLSDSRKTNQELKTWSRSNMNQL